MDMGLLLFLVLCSSMAAEASLSESDKILLLPGQPPVGFQQYSGYVTVDAKKQRALFYYFVEAEIDPASKPLVLWLNGGPGCSSLGVGAFSENGPFRPNGEFLIRNEYSWNTEANMLYLETPVGVGFSYAADGSAYETVNDQITARENLVFLHRWFVKFPQYRQRDLFITGESYAGHYIPQLAVLMVASNKKERQFNLKGIALGNPVLEYATDFNSRAEFFWSHGLISDSTYNMFTTVCNYSRYVSEYYRDSVSPSCSKVMSLVGKETSRFVDKYDVTLDVCISSVLAQSKIISPQQVPPETIDVCVEDKTVSYLNRKDVQNALHARLVGARKWDVCSDILDYDVLNIEVSTISLMGSLVKQGIRVLVYSGDQDSVIPLMGSRTNVHKLAEQLKLNTTVPYRVWFEGQQVGGWTQVYGNILSFATVRGASHEVPFSQPKRSLGLFRSFLKGRPLPEPAEKFPGLFSVDSIFGRFPYFLPCLCISLFALAVTIGSFWLPALEAASSISEDMSTTHDRALSSLGSLITNWPNFTLLEVWITLRRVHRRAQPNDGFAKILLELDRRLHGKVSMEWQQRRPLMKVCPICGKNAGLSSSSLKLHLQKSHKKLS